LSPERAGGQTAGFGEPEFAFGAHEFSAYLGIFGDEDGEDRGDERDDADAGGQPEVEATSVQKRPRRE